MNFFAKVLLKILRFSQHFLVNLKIYHPLKFLQLFKTHPVLKVIDSRKIIVYCYFKDYRDTVFSHLAYHITACSKAYSNNKKMLLIYLY